MKSILLAVVLSMVALVPRPTLAAPGNPNPNPIRIIFDMHADPRPELTGPFGAVTYSNWVEASNWLLDQTEPRGAKVSFLSVGQFMEWVLARPATGYPLMQRLYASGGQIGTHSHDDSRASPFNWTNLPAHPDSAALTKFWEDHLNLVDEVIRRALGVTDPAAIRAINFVRGSWLPSDDGERLALMASSGYTQHEQGPDEEFLKYFGHYAMNPYRPLGDLFLQHDPAGALIVAPIGSVLGSTEHMGFAQDNRVPAIQARFLLEVLNWLHDRHVAGTEKIWCKGWGSHCHDMLPGGTSRDFVVPLLDWLNEHFIDKPVGGSVCASFSSMGEVGDAYRAWETAHPGETSFSYPATTTDWSLYPYLRPPAEYLAEADYVSNMPPVGTVRWHKVTIDPEGTSPYTGYVAYSTDGGPVTVNLSASLPLPTIAAVDTVTGAATIVPRTAVPVPAKGVILVPAARVSRPDLRVTATASPNPVTDTSNFTFSVTVTNKGGGAASGIVYSNSNLAGLTFVSATSSQGSCSNTSSGVRCSLGTLPPGGTATVNVVGIPDFDQLAAALNIPDTQETITVSNLVTVTATEADAVPIDNSAVVALIVFPMLDFGDARLGYPVTRAENGARHRNGMMYHMGPAFDREVNGIHGPYADGDDLLGFPDDEDGVAIPVPLIAGHTYPITVNVSAPGWLDAFFDWNNDGDWLDAGERVTPPGGLLIVGPGPGVLTVTVPLGAVPGSPHARFRFSDVGGLAPTGFHFAGEVEDHPVEIRRVDFGSASDPTYPTLLANDGARHLVDPAWYLGAAIDWEADGLDSADGDGVVFLGPLTPGAAAAVLVTASVPGSLDAFIDFNGDGDWIDAGERITLPAGTPLGVLVNIVNFTVPTGATPGAAWARFRFSNAGGLAPTGPANIGEVEDYQVTIASPPVAALDFGDAPDTYQTLLASDGARHVITAGWTIGALIDGEAEGLPAADANGDDLSGIDDEEGVVFSAITPGKGSMVQITVSVPAGQTGYLNGWMDFQHNGSWNEPEDHIIVDYPVPAGTVVLPLGFTVPSTAIPGLSYARFRLSPNPGLSFFGAADAGEVEDYGFECDKLDFGDAPDSYRTSSSVDGARHVVSPQFCLGVNEDKESDGIPSATALGDDSATPLGFDDEDGLSAMSALVPGVAATFNVFATIPGGTTAYLDAWGDWNRDGDFDDADEQIAVSRPMLNMLNVVGFTVPSSALTGTTYVRLRLSSTGGLPSFGLAPDGEVEDYQVTITTIVAPPVVVFGGLPHVTLGNATVSVSSNGLQLANLGSNGTDGVRINLGRAEGWRGEVTSFYDWSDIIWSARGSIGGQSNQPLGSLRIERAGSNLTFSADFSGLGASQYIAEYYDQSGVHLSSTPPMAARQTITILGCVCHIEVFADSIYILVCDCDFDIPGGGFPGGSPGGVLVKLSAVAPTASPEFVSAVEIRGTGSLTLGSEALRQFGLWHRFVGGAASGTVDTDGDPTLRVRNLGASGAGGIETLVGGPEYIGELPAGNLLRQRVVQFWCCWDDWFLTSSNSHVRWTATGRVTGSANEYYDTEMLWFKQEQGTALSASFAALGATQAQVDVFNGLAHVGSFTLPGLGKFNASTGGVARVAAAITDGTPVWTVKWDTRSAFTPSNGVPLIGDRLRIAAINPTMTVEGLRSLITRGANVESLSVGGFDTAMPQRPRLSPPRLLPGGGLQLPIPTEPDVTYDIESSPSVNGPWTNIGRVMGIDGMNITTFEDATLRISNRIFFRVRVR